MRHIPPDVGAGGRQQQHSPLSAAVSHRSAVVQCHWGCGVRAQAPRQHPTPPTSPGCVGWVGMGGGGGGGGEARFQVLGSKSPNPAGVPQVPGSGASKLGFCRFQVLLEGPKVGRRPVSEQCRLPPPEVHLEGAYVLIQLGCGRAGLCALVVTIGRIKSTPAMVGSGPCPAPCSCACSIRKVVVGILGRRSRRRRQAAGG